MIEMRESEWLVTAATLRERWPNADLPAESLAEWGRDLQDLPGDHVQAAVDVIYREGARFAPNGAQIRRKVVALTLDAPPWADVFAELRGDPTPEGNTPTPESCEVDVCDGSGWIVGVDEDDYEVARSCECRRLRSKRIRERRERRHGLVKQFVKLYGPQIHDGIEGGGGSEARLRQKWEDFCDRKHREIAVAGLPAHGLPGLERINREAPRSIAEIVDGVRNEIEAESRAA